MYPISVRFFLALATFFFTLSFSKTPIPPASLILYGDAFLNATSIVLTKPENCTSLLPPLPIFIPKFSVGGAFHANPFRFLDPPANAAASFSCVFSFTVSGADSCPFSGDGFTFLITPNTNFSSPYDGYMGLPIEGSDYFAVEFDTSFDPILGDINGNHVAIDSNSIRSVASFDLLSREIDLKNGKEWTVWIEYRDTEKSITVSIGPSKETKPLIPVLEAQIDLSMKFQEFMYVGFTASNGKGSSLHHINTWKFKTFFGAIPSTAPLDISEQENCLMCSSLTSNMEAFTPLGHHHPRKQQTLNRPLLFGGLTSLAVIVFISSIVILRIYLKQRRRRLVQAHQMHTRFQGGRMVPEMLSLTEIKSATNGFNQDRIIGEGSSAIVYEGSIPNCGPVAVKRFNPGNQANPSTSTRIPFNTEFATMVGCLKHKNLLQLQGWCCEGNELVLVYEYMSNGSLDNILHNRAHSTRLLPWERRMKIVLGVASALIYLHEECERQIIHRDIKTCNVLLDSNFNAKLGDFGMAEVYRHSLGAQYATSPAGTLGYLAPEYVFSGVSSVKTDVYSFGVVVLEVATGRKPVDENGVSMSDYVWGLWEKGKIVEGADRNLMGRFDRGEMKRVLMVGLWCVHPDCRERPKVRDAVRMLRGECVVPVLPERKPGTRIQSEREAETRIQSEREAETRIQSEVPGWGLGLLLRRERERERERKRKKHREERERERESTPWSTPRTQFSKE